MTDRTACRPILPVIILGLLTAFGLSTLQAQEYSVLLAQGSVGDLAPEAPALDDVGKPALACGKCGQDFPCCQLIPCTIMVCEQVKETHVKTCLTTVKEEREETYTVFKRVPKTRTYTKERCYLADEIKTKTITEEKCHTVHLPVVRDCQTTAVERRCCPSGNGEGKCNSCNGKECGQNPCQCEVAVIREEKHSSESCEPQVVIAKSTRQIDYCVKSPKSQKCVTEETSYKLEPVTRTRTVTVCVPKYVKEPKEVIVCRTVPKTVMCCTCCAKECQRGLDRDGK